MQVARQTQAEDGQVEILPSYETVQLEVHGQVEEDCAVWTWELVEPIGDKRKKNNEIPLCKE